MSWINEHRRVGGFVLLALLLIAFVGPWGYDRINVPAQYPCHAPFIRLEGDFCGTPLSGIWMLAILPAELISVFEGTFSGKITFGDLGNSLLRMLYVLFALLPVISTFLWILPGNRKHQSIFYIVAWGLAAVFMMRLLSLPVEVRPGQLWGLWLYTGLVPSVLIYAVVSFVNRKWSHQAM